MRLFCTLRYLSHQLGYSSALAATITLLTLTSTSAARLRLSKLIAMIIMSAIVSMRKVSAVWSKSYCLVRHL